MEENEEKYREHEEIDGKIGEKCHSAFFPCHVS